MAEVCYTARAMTKQQVLDGVNKLTLQTNKHRQYTHDAILLLQKGIRCVLISQFNLGKSMENYSMMVIICSHWCSLQM